MTRGGVAPTAEVRQVDLILVWDRWSGWAHLATHQRGSSDQPRFAGIVHLPTADAAAVRVRLARAGFEVHSEYSVDDQLLEFRLATSASSPAAVPAAGAWS
ncbi:hypothetical protein [Amycolatopsis tucumanensis]|uniref:Glyoxalase-like domain-containing protein n=1 Tax=Amycolatopsis tucumanensis TaxID=401106 RepID=A0ABP7HGR0_9PSEU|nr:hypothetical protein [Amycolatopsis tucumanensis]MCF6423697.1 hypothetical protein [Amycolatopsis tucumanensis]